VSLEVSSKELGILARKLRREADLFPRRLREKMRKATLAIYADARDRSNWGNRDDPKPLPPPGPLRNISGRLSRSINWRLDEEPGGFVGRVGTNVFYGKLHELGYVGMVERIRWEGDIPYASQFQIRIPPRPFLAPAYTRQKQTVTRYLGEAFTETNLETK
jgi:phage gpG-like protein